MNNFSRRKMLLPGIAGGLIILILAILLRSSPPEAENYSPARSVDVIPLAKRQVAPTIIGYGMTAPKVSWQMLAEVSGQVIFKHPQLEHGRSLPEGTLLARIDPLEYQLALAQADENLNAARARLAQLKLEEKTVQASLAIEQKKLVNAQQEYQRKQMLKQQKLISTSELENQQQNLLSQEQQVQNLKNRELLLPDEINVAIAQIKLEQAKVDNSKRLLAKTDIHMPFDGKLGNVAIELGQLVPLGSQLFTVDKQGVIEVKADFSLADISILRKNLNGPIATQQSPDFASLEALALGASIELQVLENTFTWPARVTRVAETIEPTQGTQGVYLTVDTNSAPRLKQPVDESNSDTAMIPELVKGILVSATISGHPVAHFVVPEQALHGDKVYLVGTDNQLEIRQVKVLFRSQLGVAISGELKSGELLVLNDLIPAVPGMLLKPDAVDSRHAQTQESDSLGENGGVPR